MIALALAAALGTEPGDGPRFALIDAHRPLYAAPGERLALRPASGEGVLPRVVAVVAEGEGGRWIETTPASARHCHPSLDGAGLTVRLWAPDDVFLDASAREVRVAVDGAELRVGPGHHLRCDARSCRPVGGGGVELDLELPVSARAAVFPEGRAEALPETVLAAEVAWTSADGTVAVRAAAGSPARSSEGEVRVRAGCVSARWPGEAAVRAPEPTADPAVRIARRAGWWAGPGAALTWVGGRPAGAVRDRFEHAGQSACFTHHLTETGDALGLCVDLLDTRPLDALVVPGP